MDNNREEILINIADKLYNNLIETSKSIKHLFVYIFALLVIISAITFEPEILIGSTEVSNDGTIQSQTISLLGFSITIDSVVKYSSIILSILYLMLTAFLVYSEHLRVQVIETYCSLDSAMKEEINRLHFPSLNNIISELASKHESTWIKLFFQILNVLMSLLIYVLPVIVVIILLGEGLKRSDNAYLNSIFYSAPVIMFICMIILTKQWYITVWESTIDFAHYLSRIIKAIYNKEVSIKYKIEFSKILNIFNLLIVLIAIIISVISSLPLILEPLKKLFE